MTCAPSPLSQAATIAGDHVILFASAFGFAGIVFGIAAAYLIWRDRLRHERNRHNAVMAAFVDGIWTVEDQARRVA